MSTKPLPQVELIDFDSIKLVGDQSNPEVVEISSNDGFFLNDKFTSDFRTRKSIYKMMQAAQKHLPDNYHFMIYEAYRPLARQVELWGKASAYLKEEYPELEGQQLRDLIETFVADPHNGIGSGHQACCAIDISLCDKTGKAYDMGSQCQEICEEANTASQNINEEARKNRDILVGALETEGFINYASEWWHFSYGDHQWAYLTNQTEAFFGPIDI
jgi:D-alanyl-D-alanine dipeptidase